MMTLADWLSDAAKRIASATPRLDAEYLLAQRLGKNRAYLLAFADEVLSEAQTRQLAQDVARLADGYPLAYLLGEKAFWDMTLTVTEDTLIPRADTETLIEVAQQVLPADYNGTIMDVGTGSGAIAIALSRVFVQARLWACDNSPAALAVAERNAKQWQDSRSAPIVFVHADWLRPLDGTTLPLFDMIVGNPPYIAEGDTHLAALRHEPITALTAADKGLADIKNIIDQAKQYLKPDGWLMLEHGYDQGQAVRDCLSQAHAKDTDRGNTGREHIAWNSIYWKNIKTYKDLGGNERITVGQCLN